MQLSLVVSTGMNMESPAFLSERLNEIVAAFGRRSKAIKHRICKLEITREDDDGDERLNVDCRGLESPPVQTRVSIWPDGGIYCRKCQGSKKGWRFNIELHGDAADVAPGEIVKLFEGSLGIEDENELMSSWRIVEPHRQ